MPTTSLTHPLAGAEARPTTRAAWLGLTVVIAAAVMDLLNSTITQTAVPPIRRDLGGSYADLEWFTAAYTLAMSSTLLLGSRLGDTLGRRRVLLAGIGAFVVASILCALAPSATMLIAARSVQGAVAAIMVPQGFGLIREVFGDRHQQKAFAVFGPVMGLAAVTGPLLGGGLVSLNLLGSGWRAIFLVNVPLGLAAILAGRRLLPRTEAATRNARLDLPSVLLAMGGVVALVYPIIQGHARSGCSPHRVVAGCAAGRDRLRDGHGLRAHVRRDPRPRETARARLGLGTAGVRAAAGHVGRDRRHRNGAVRSPRRRGRSRAVRARGRSRPADRRGAAARRGRSGLLAAPPRAR